MLNVMPECLLPRASEMFLFLHVTDKNCLPMLVGDGQYSLGYP